MKLKLVLFFIISGINLQAQQVKPAEQEAPYKKNPTLPLIEMVQPDSNTLTKVIYKKQPTLIMYFSPDCEHCIKQVEEMNTRMDDLKKLQIIMITHEPMESLVTFIDKYKLKQYPNIQLGRDVKFTLPGFYRIKSLPYFALYDKNGALITTFESNTSVDKILKSYKKK